MPLGKELKRMLEGNRDPLGLDAELHKYFKRGDPFQFSQKTIDLAVEILRGGEIRNRDPKIFHASAAGACRRQQILAIYHPDRIRVDPLDAIQRMDDGKWGHLKWQMVLYEMGLLKRWEFQVRYRPWNAGGAPDGVLVLPWLDPDREFLLEIKRVSDYRFTQMLRTGAPEHGFILQTHTYIQATDLAHIIYFVENKNTNDWKIFYQRRDLEVVKYLRERYKYMNHYLLNKSVPPPDCTFQKNDKMFQYCDMKKICIDRLKKKGTWKQYGPPSAA